MNKGLKERDYWLGFNVFPGIGPKRLFHLLKIFGSAKKSWQAAEGKLRRTKIPKPILAKFFQFREEFNFSSYLLRLNKSLIRFVIIEEEEYPKNLKKIDNPPPLIFMKGRIIPQDSLSIAVIGTRRITPYGREVTEKLTRELISYGITIVSGLARGVDSVSHRLALGNGGRTIAVLGSGLNNIYPPEHQALAEKIVNQDQGALVSEVALEGLPLKGHFPSRNRIISGLSLGVLVTEGAAVSGTKITSQYCLKHERKLFAVPGPITSPLSEGPADLIKMGAKLVTKAGDVLSELEVKKQSAVKKRERLEFSSDGERKIWEALTSGVKHIDELIRETGLPSFKTLSLLTTMELAGKVKNIGQGNYMLA